MKKLLKKRRFLAAFTATLLILTAFVTSCSDLMDDMFNQQGNNQKGKDSTQAPVGKGLVRISIADPDARSILPTLPALNSMYYSVQFTGLSNNNSIGDPIAENISMLTGAPIVLPADTYKIVITAWDDDDTSTAEPLAGWTGTGIVVEEGTSTPVNANLLGWTESGATGDFYYSIDVPDYPTTTTTSWTITSPPSSYNVAQMEVINASSVVVNTVDLIPYVDSKAADTISALPAGYYTVIITLTADDCQDRIIKEVMHIYNTMTSDYTYSVPVLNQNKFTVAYDFNGKSNTNGSFTGDQSGIPFLGTVTNPGTPTNATNDFEGWYEDSGGTGDKWVFGGSGTKVFKDTKLYAQWTAKPDVPISTAAIAGVTPPETGATPVSTVTETDQYTGTVVWSGTPATFASATQYTATITLSPKSGYTLTGVAANFFTVAGAETVDNAADSGTITAVFPTTKTTINIAAILGVTVPVTGETPVTEITESTQYTGEVTWSGNPTTFAPETVYTATITLSPKSGYTLTGVAANFFTVAGTSPSATNSAGTGVITAVFPATAPIVINNANVPVPKPVAGATPTTTFTTTQYDGSVVWTPTVVSTTFAANTVYTAEITLTANTGYTLTGVEANFFKVAGATSVSNAANSGVINVTFPSTTTGVEMEITFIVSNGSITPSVTGTVTSPITYKNILDGKTILTFTLEDGISGVTWEMEGVSATEGTDKTLVIDDSSSLLPYLVTGTHILSVKGTGIGGSYSQTIKFVIN